MTAQIHVAHYMRCVNLECPNTSDGGTFSMVHLRDDAEPVVGGNRNILLVMCAPCATALRTQLLSGDVTA